MTRRSWWFLALAVAACYGAPPSAPPDLPPDKTNNPPIAVLRVMQSGQEGTFPVAIFSAEGTRDPDGDTLSYTWDFGDGMSITTMLNQQNHAYLDDGTYQVVLTVTDTHKAQGRATAEVFVYNSTPQIVSAELSTPPQPAPIPMTAVMHARVTDQGPLDNPVLNIDWGDGTVSTDTTHLYHLPGIYHPKVWATDKDGASSQVYEYSIWAYDPAGNYQVPGYEIVDLGTLGGDWTFPVALNNRGEVVGSSKTASDSVHAFLWRDGRAVDLNPPGNDIRWARIITDAGLIAGVASGFSGELPVWRDGAFTGFKAVPKSEYGAWPVAITEVGDLLVNVEGHEFPNATLMRGSTAIKLGGIHSAAVDMNSHEQVVGWVGLKFIGEDAVESHGFFWQNGVFHDLGSIGTAPCLDMPEKQCGGSMAYSINEQGQIVGFSFDGTVNRAVSWNAAELVPHDLGFGPSSRAVAINDNGQIAGDSEDEGALFRDNGTVIKIGTLGGKTARVVDLNAHGAVVGSSLTAAGPVHAFIWTRSSGIRDLGAGPYSGPGVGSVAVAINDRGDVLGYTLACTENDGVYCMSWGPMRAILWRYTGQTTALKAN